MTEPIYIYRKGMGWMVCTNITTMSCGTAVTLESRKPKSGEKYVWAYRRDYNVADRRLNQDFEMNMDFWKVALQGWRFKELECYSDEDEIFYSDVGRDSSFLVITKV